MTPLKNVYFGEKSTENIYLKSQKVEVEYYSYACIYLLGITHLTPHNELVHLPYIAVATNTRAD